jgi:multidrug resistance protein, MATE family
MCFAFGMQYTTTIFAGTSLGEGNVPRAYTFAKASFLMVACATVIIGTLVITYRSSLVLLFTEDAQVRELFGAAMIFTVIETIPDSNQFVLQGIIKSLGKQDQAFSRCVLCQIVLGMPLAYWLGVYCGFGIPGLLMGLGIGNTLLCALYYRIAYSEHWDDVAKRISERLEDNKYLE